MWTNVGFLVVRGVLRVLRVEPSADAKTSRSRCSATNWPSCAARYPDLATTTPTGRRSPHWPSCGRGMATGRGMHRRRGCRGAAVSRVASRRSALFEAMTGLLVTLAETAVVVVVLEDRQWADPHLSLSLLEHLAVRVQTSHGLIVATSRPSEYYRQGPITDTIGTLARLAKTPA